jgi:hypothetical protein
MGQAQGPVGRVFAAMQELRSALRALEARDAHAADVVADGAVADARDATARAWKEARGVAR